MINKDNILLLKRKHPHTGVVGITKDIYKSIDEDINKFYSGKLSKTKFIEKYNFSPLSIIMYGEVKNVESSQLKELIEYENIQVEANKYKLSYKCFCGEEYNLDYKKDILHGTSFSSWQCALIKIGNPEYAIIFNLDEINK